jgi:hypothetical protein
MKSEISTAETFMVKGITRLLAPVSHRNRQAGQRPERRIAPVRKIFASLTTKQHLHNLNELGSLLILCFLFAVKLKLQITATRFIDS